MSLEGLANKHSLAWIRRHIVKIDEQPWDFGTRMSLVGLSYLSAILWVFTPNEAVYFAQIVHAPDWVWVTLLVIQGTLLVMPFKFRLFGYIMGATTFIGLGIGQLLLVVFYGRPGEWPELLGLYALAMIHLSGARSYTLVLAWQQQAAKQNTEALEARRARR